MNSLIPFNFNGHVLNTMLVNDEPYFIARNVAEILGYSKPENAIARHCKASITTPKQGGGYITLIPERDVYRLTMRSKLEESEKFENWVVSEVLPSIRKTGSYQFNPSIPQTLPEALRLAADLAEKNTQLSAKLIELEPKAEALDRIATADGSLCLTNAAKDLQVRPKDLFNNLQENKWIYRRNGSGSFTAYQDKIQQGLLEHKVTTVYRSDGTEKVTEQVRVTPKGIAKLSQMLETMH